MIERMEIFLMKSFVIALVMLTLVMSCLLYTSFLEGNFYFETRSKKMIMERLQTSIRKKLSWLNCSVSVTDSSTYKKKFFTIRQNQTGSC